MCGGGGGAPEQKPSAQEITAAKEAVNKYNERHTDGYVGLERDAITDSKVDHTEPFRGVTSAELAKQEAQAYEMAAAGRRGIDFSDVGLATSLSKAAGDNEARFNALGLKDTKTMGVVNTGQDIANNSAGATMNLAQGGAVKGLAKLEGEITQLNARNKAISSVLGTAMSAGAYKYGQYQDVNDPVKQADVKMDYNKSLQDAYWQPQPAPNPYLNKRNPYAGVA